MYMLSLKNKYTTMNFFVKCLVSFKSKTLGLCQKTKKVVGHEGDDVTNSSRWAWKEDKKNWKSEEELRPFRWQYSWDWSEYWEEFWRSEETCCHSDSSERLSVKTGVKNKQAVK